MSKDIFSIKIEQKPSKKEDDRPKKEERKTGDLQKKKTQPKADIEKLQTPGAVDIKTLQWGMLYLKHRRKIKFSVYVFLILISAITWYIFLKTFGEYWLVGQKLDEAMIGEIGKANLISHRQLVAHLGARDLQVNSPQTFKIGPNVYDFVALVANPNDDFYVSFTYHFVVNGQIISTSSDFILPSESKYLMLLGRELNFRPSQVGVTFSKIDWRRIDGHQIPDWRAYRDQRINFQITDTKFISPARSNLSEKRDLSVVEFKIKNLSPFNYTKGELLILLFQRGKLVSANKYVIEDFLSDEERFISLTWPHPIRRADKVEVIPSFDITKDIYFIP
ncbi:hypothetical protein D6821_01565 [Candidatus Parcubacteria bacterium]|nr:MAG: hypothetical protein D6821_01565 [Candidatus Parcubacteria bacterium]